MNTITVILIFNNVRLGNISGLSLVAATIDRPCDNYIDQTSYICKILPYNYQGDCISYIPPCTRRTQAEEDLAECCSAVDFGMGPQEFCLNNKCYGQLLWEYNKDIKIDPTINVYVREEKVWLLDKNGYLTPAKIMIKVW